MLVGAGLLFLLAEGWAWLRDEEGMGLGDAKLLAMVGAFLGWKGVLITLFLACLAGSLVGVALLITARGGAKTRLPFGAFLALGAAVTLFGGTALARSLPATAVSDERRRPWLGLRREIAILFPVALLVLTGLAIFALLSYRGAIARLTAERHAEAERVARAAAVALRGAPSPRPETLRALAPQALGIALLDERGVPVAQAGEIAPYALPAELAAAGSAAAGPDDLLVGAVAGFAPLAPSGLRRWVRVDLPAPGLAAQARALRLLTPLVVGVSLAVCVLVLLFLRHAFAPYDTLLARARQAGALDADGEDEITSLVTTFERALAALGRRGGAEDDIAALERALAPSLESGLLLLDREGRVVALNPAGAGLLELAPPPPGTPLATALAAQPALASLLRRRGRRGPGPQPARSARSPPAPAGAPSA